ncbi:MAG: DUF2079 domain-containing protein [Caldilineales bacterium]
MRHRWRIHLPYLALLLVGTGFLLAQSLLQQRALGTGYDLGIYDQTVWNLSHGRIWETTLVYETGGYYDHFEPILALFVPLYWLWPDVRVLLVVQAVALGLGSLPIYLFAYVRLMRLRPSNIWLAVVIAAIYLLYPALQHANLNDFHEISLLPPLLGFTLYGLLRGRRRVMFIFLALSLLVKEDVAITALAISAYIIVLRPAGFRRRDGVVLAALMLVWTWLILNVFYPGLTRGMAYPFVDRRYSWLATSAPEALKVLLTRPWVILPPLVEPPKLLFLLRLFGPLLLLPLLGWPVIGLALPILIYLMLSSYQPQWSVQSYYNPPLLPFLFFALVVAVDYIQRLARGNLRRARRLAAATVTLTAIATAAAYYVDAPGPGSRAFDASRFRVSQKAEAAYELMAQIPAESSVSTIWPLISHLSHRQQIYTVLARPTEPPAYRLYEEMPGAEGAPIYPYAAPDGSPTLYHEYGLVEAADAYRLEKYERSVPMQPLPQPDPQPSPLSLDGYAWLDSPDPAQPPALAAGQPTRLMLAWRRTGALDRRYVVFIHVLDPVRKQADGAPAIVTQNDHEPGGVVPQRPSGSRGRTRPSSWTSSRSRSRPILPQEPTRCGPAPTTRKPASALSWAAQGRLWQRLVIWWSPDHETFSDASQHAATLLAPSSPCGAAGVGVAANESCTQRFCLRRHIGVHVGSFLVRRRSAHRPEYCGLSTCLFPAGWHYAENLLMLVAMLPLV